MKKILIVTIIGFLLIIDISASNLEEYTYKISNAKLLDFRGNNLDIGGNKRGLKIENTSLVSTYLEKPIITKYHQTNLYKKLIPAIEKKGYNPVFFDYAGVQNNKALHYTFHHDQEYTLTNTTNKTQTYNIKFYPITPSPFAAVVMEGPYKKCPDNKDVIISPDYDIINIKLKSSRLGFINFSKQYSLLKRDYSQGFRDGSRCKTGNDTGLFIYSYYEAEIKLESQESIDLNFSYNSLDFFSSDTQQKGNLHISGYDYLFPLEPTYIDFPNIIINTPADYEIYHKNGDIAETNHFNEIRNKVFNIIKK